MLAGTPFLIIDSTNFLTSVSVTPVYMTSVYMIYLYDMIYIWYDTSVYMYMVSVYMTTRKWNHIMIPLLCAVIYTWVTDTDVFYHIIQIFLARLHSWLLYITAANTYSLLKLCHISLSNMFYQNPEFFSNFFLSSNFLHVQLCVACQIFGLQ